jgi:hypothetical protein
LAAIGVAGAIAMTPTAAQAAPLIPGAPETYRIPSYDNQLQPNGFYCGPAATRIALTAHGFTPPQVGIAGALGTTEAGTASINEVTRVLNNHVGARYGSVEISNRDATQAQTDQLQRDVVYSINQNDPVVANVAGTTMDTDGEYHSYPGGHYLTITGYTDEGRRVIVTDPADRVGSNEYQVPTDWMADWIATRGYTSNHA